jgi:hypothetical protein
MFLSQRSSSKALPRPPAIQTAVSQLKMQSVCLYGVEESQKAGATALQFDPHATPEEKAAQAKAVSSVQ